MPDNISDVDRRSFLCRWLPAIPFLAATMSRAEPALRFIRYSAKSKVGPWVGWLETKAGVCVGFVDSAGKRFLY